jgi:Protein of unknown function (DUF3822)
VETGSDLASVLSFRKVLHLLPDRIEELNSPDLFNFLEIGRSHVCILAIDRKQRKALSFSKYEFPFSLQDTRWAELVSQVLTEVSIQNFSVAVVDDLPCTIIPSDLFPSEKKDLKALITLENGLIPDSTLIETNLDSLDANCVFGLPNVLNKVIHCEKIIPAFAAWMPSLIRNPTSTHIHVHVSNQSFRLALLQGKGLLLHNTFNFSAHEDVLYFTLAALEQLSILHSETTLTLYGNVAKGDHLHSLFTKYISQVYFAEKPTELGYSYSFKDLPNHMSPFLLNAPKCA